MCIKAVFRIIVTFFAPGQKVNRMPDQRYGE